MILNARENIKKAAPRRTTQSRQRIANTNRLSALLL